MLVLPYQKSILFAIKLSAFSSIAIEGTVTVNNQKFPTDFGLGTITKKNK